MPTARAVGNTLVSDRGYTIIVVQIRQMLGIRFAGDKLRQMDDSYSKAVADMYIKDGAQYGDVEGSARGLAAGLLGGIPLSEMSNKGNDVAPKSIVLANALARYAAPTAGVAAAYHGIQGLMSTEQTSGTVMP